MPTAETTPESPVLDLRAIPGTWGLVTCKMREEKAIAARIEERGASVYLPTLRERRPYRGCVKELELAACPGNLFVAWREDDQYSALWSTRGVSEVRRIARQEQFIRQLCDFQTVLASREFRGMDRWRRGQPVQIRQGHALAGIRGWLANDRESDVIAVGYPVLGLVATAQVDAVFIELLDAADAVAA